MIEYIKVRVNSSPDNKIIELGVKPKTIENPSLDGREMNFAFTYEEFCDFVKGQRPIYGYSSYSIVERGGGCVTLMYTDVPIQKTYNTISTTFVNFNLQFFVRKMLQKIADNHYKICEASDNKYLPSLEFALNMHRLEKFEKLYSPGSGKADLIMDERTETFLDEVDSSQLWERINYVKTIAQNNTTRFWQKKKLRLSKDMDGFFFQIEGSMHGGIVNHGSKEKPDWSIHT